MSSQQLFQVSYAVLWFLVIAEGVALFLVFRQFGVMFLNTREGIENDGLDVGTEASDFALPGASGRIITLSEALEGKRGAVIVFGAPHCRPCHQLLPDLQRFAQEHAADIATLFVSRGSEEENQFFAGTFGGPAVLLFDDLEGKVAAGYRTRVTPFAFAVGGLRTVRSKGLANTHDQLVQMVSTMQDGSRASVKNQATSE